MKYIIARYQEDISWSDGLDRFVVQKGEHLPNVGREASSWLWYIHEFYDELEGVYAFRQGSPDGDPYHGQPHGITLTEDRQVFGWDTQRMADHLGVVIPEALGFIAGAQYDVEADVLRCRSKEWYAEALHVAGTWDWAPWMFERIWPYIWEGKAKPWTPTH